MECKRFLNGNNILKLLIVLGVILSAWYIIATQHSPTHTEDGKLIIHFWQTWTRFERDALQEIVDSFNESQDDIYVDMLTVTGDPARKLMLAASAGNPPDIASIWSDSTTYASKGALMPLSKLCEEAGFDENYFMPAIWEDMNSYGFIWFLPNTAYDYTLYWNKQLFREAGLDPNQPPRTIEELDEMSDRLTIVKIKRNGVGQSVRFTDLTEKEKKDKNFEIEQLGFSPSIPGNWKTYFPFWFGAKYWNGSDKLLLNSREGHEAISWYAGYGERYGADNLNKFESAYGKPGSASDPFITENMAMVFFGSWMFNFIRAFNPSLDWDTAAFPGVNYDPENPITYVGSDLLVIPRDSKHPKEAFEFLKYMISQKQMEKLCLEHNKFTPLSTTSKEFIDNHTNPAIEKLASIANSKKAVAPSKVPIANRISNDLSTAYERAFLGLESPEESLNNVQELLQRELVSSNRVWNRVKEKRMKEWSKENDAL